MKNWRYKIFLKLNGRIIFHGLFWIIVIAGYTGLYGYSSKGAYLQAFILLVTTLPIYMGATYYTIYHILPNLLFKKKYSAFIVHFIYMSLISMLLELLAIMFVFVIPIRPFGLQTATLNPIRVDIGFLMVGIYLVILLGTAIKLLKHWYTARDKNLILSREKVEAELKLLKSQIHPHFLFNTLNNLYALALEKSDQTPEVILKLSELLDYMLYECNQPLVLLEKDIEMLRNYIALESLRYGDRLNLTFEIEGDIRGMQIAPLLLLPFIENSFKHGAGKIGNRSRIDIRIAIHSDVLNASISNSVSTEKIEHQAPGLGLENVRKRLELLYPEKHTLAISQSDDQYSVSLNLDLKGNSGETI